MHIAHRRLESSANMVTIDWLPCQYPGNLLERVEPIPISATAVFMMLGVNASRSVGQQIGKTSLMWTGLTIRNLDYKPLFDSQCRQVHPVSYCSEEAFLSCL